MVNKIGNLMETASYCALCETSLCLGKDSPDHQAKLDEVLQIQDPQGIKNLITKLSSCGITNQQKKTYATEFANYESLVVTS